MEVQMLQMARRCSYCTDHGHNSRTCPNRSIKIFGVRLTNGAVMKNSSTRSNPAIRDQKKGGSWTEAEHRMFLIGLRQLGRGYWRGLARNYVTTRTPAQVASHAQKFFNRQKFLDRPNGGSSRKRRASLFDMAPPELADAPVRSLEPDVQGNIAQPVPPVVEKESEAMDSNSNSNSNDGQGYNPNMGSLPFNYPVLYPTVVPPFYLYFPFQYWPGEPKEQREHGILKPTAVRVKAPINVDELTGMSKLSLGDSLAVARPSFLSLKQPDGSVRKSAFRAIPPSG